MIEDEGASAVFAKVTRAVQAMRDIESMSPEHAQAALRVIVEIHKQFPLPNAILCIGDDL